LGNGIARKLYFPRRSVFTGPRAMKILWVGTKPPWPANDGGRLLAVVTLEALAHAGHQVTLVAPYLAGSLHEEGVTRALRRLCEPILLPVALPTRQRAALSSIAAREPVSVLRHTHPAVRERVAALLDGQGYDVVHAEQPQALAQCAPAFARGLPVVMRAQNVEADLWRAAARSLTALPARLEARRMARFEGRAVRRTAATIALTRRDADRLRELSGEPSKIHQVAAPFPPRMPAAEEPLAGAPAVVLMGSAGWLPNERGTAWFLGKVWPDVRRALPGALLHFFGEPRGAAAGPGVVMHGPLEDSRQAFAPNAVLVVPVPFASGVRMRILEAWARGVPVLSSAQGAVGLDADEGRHLLVARSAADYVAGLRLLALDAKLGPALVGEARAFLAARHHPEIVGAGLSAVYADCVAAARRRG